jgi:hypothetical protein
VYARFSYHSIRILNLVERYNAALGGKVEHFSEVVKILDAAMLHDPTKASAYGSLLASKLDEDQQLRQARAIRSILAKLPAPTIGASHASPRVPVDGDNSLSLVDLIPPGDLDASNLVLHPYASDRLKEFLDAVRMHDEWEARGFASANRLLIYGPPGTGKTTLAARVASELSLPLIVSRSDALVSSLLGQTSRNIRSIFEFAESSPCVLLLDEFDALAKDRADSREIGELQRVVIALLQNIDALDASTIVIAATNHPELLDPAVWRRFDYLVRVDLPSARDRQQMWTAYLQDQVPPPAMLGRLVDLSEGMSGAAIRLVANDIRRTAFRGGGSTPIGLAPMLQRLARVRWHDSYDRFETQPTEIAALRAWAPDVFTAKALSELFSVSIRQVNNAIKGGSDVKL